MKSHPSSTATSIATAAALTLPDAASAAADADALLSRIRSKDDRIRCQAWQSAGSVGAPAIGPLGLMLADADPEVGRAARHAIERIVHHAGRPGAASEARAVETELVALLKRESAVIRRTALWMLSENGGDGCIEAVSALLADAQVRDDARCALQRIPGDTSLAALKDALNTAPEPFRFAVAESLRKRGQTVAGYPTKKLVPALSTQIKAATANGK